MKDPVVKGHPLHAILTDIPVGSAVTGVALDMVASITRSQQWRFAATASFGAAFLSGSLTALIGLWDYQAVPREHPARQTGALHGYLNAGALTMLGLSVLTRTRAAKSEAADSADMPIGSAQRMLPLAALMFLGSSGWLGGEMVYKQGWRVLPAEHAEQLEASLRKSGDEARINAAHETVEKYERAHALVP
jgi:uncharacterized membrane protein